MSSISIIIPAFNRADIIPFTLDSILNQSFKNFQCIVVDDHSNDETAEIIKRYSQKDYRIIYQINMRSKGAQGARNTGLLKADGDFVIFFDSDNLMHKDFLLKTSMVLDSNLELDICTTYSNIVNEYHKKTGTFNWNSNGNILFDLLTGKTYIDFNSTLIRKRMIDKLGLLDELCPSYQEYDTFIRLAGTANFKTIPEPMIDYYRRGTDSISSDIKRDFEGFFYVLKKHRLLWLKIVGGKIYKKRLRELSNRFLKLNDYNAENIQKAIPEFKIVHRRQKLVNYIYTIKWLLNK